MFIQCVNEMVHIMHVGIFYAKVIYHQAESDVPPDVAPETRCVLALVVPFGSKGFLK